MALVKCRECGVAVSTNAAACPACGSRQPKRTSGCAIAVVAVLFLPVFAVIVGQLREPAPVTATQRAKADEGVTATLACKAAQDAVRAKLKAPATAEFPSCGYEVSQYEIRATPDGATVWVLGHVDAQNSFGAKLRYQFGVKMARQADTFRVEDVQLSPQ